MGDEDEAEAAFWPRAGSSRARIGWLGVVRRDILRPVASHMEPSPNPAHRLRQDPAAGAEQAGGLAANGALPDPGRRTVGDLLDCDSVAAESIVG